MDFIKKNIALTIVLVITLGVSGYLGFLFWKEIQAYDVANQRVEKAKSTRDKLERAPVAPQVENLNAVKADQERIAALVKELQGYFGKPYAKAGEKFREVVEAKLPDLDYDKYIEKIKQKWISETSSLQMGMKFLKINDSLTKDIDGFEPIPQDVLTDAIKAFELQFDRMSLGVKMKDYRTLASKMPFFLDTIGINRTMLQTASRRYLNDQRDAVLKYLDSKDCFYNPALRSYFTFGLTAQEVPRLKNIPIYIKQLDITFDLLKRLADSSILRLSSFKNESLAPVTDGKFEVYRYTIDFLSNLESLRQFMTNLNEAYKSNRVYTIKAIKIVRQNARGLESDSTRVGSYYKSLVEGLKSQAVAKLYRDLGEDGYISGGFYQYPNIKGSSASSYTPSMGGGMSSDEDEEDSYQPQQPTQTPEEITAEQQAELDRQKAKKDATAMDKFPGYGELVIGANKDVQVQLVIDYTIYVGDNLKQ